MCECAIRIFQIQQANTVLHPYQFVYCVCWGGGGVGGVKVYDSYFQCVRKYVREIVYFM